MRRAAWVLLLAFAFAVPWEYSLDLGAPLGNVARLLGLLLLAAALPALLQSGGLRRPGVLQWLVLAFFVWICCTCLWSIDRTATLERMRGYFQELMIVWLVWEFAETPRDLRALLRVFVAGSWVLALLTLWEFRSLEAIAAGQIRFAAYGQDPNDVARFLDLGFPSAALLAAGGSDRWDRLLGLGYLPVGLLAVLLTASRGGFLAAAVALAGSAALLARGRGRTVLGALYVLPAVAAALWLVVPGGTIARLATIPEELGSGDLNQRINIWGVGWTAFQRAPIWGAGAGTFTAAAGVSPIDTAHNTALSIAVGGGLVALSLVLAILVCAVALALCMRGSLRLAMLITLLVWVVLSLVGTVEENRTTWLLFGLIAAAGRFAVEEPEALACCFPDPAPAPVQLSGTASEAD